MSSSQSISKTNESPDLSPILGKLGRNVMRMMANLYDLQVATINKNGHDPYAPQMKELRRTVQQDWERIIAFLKQSHQFADDINYLRIIVSTASKAELEQFLLDLIAASKELRTESEALAAEGPDVSTPYEAIWGQKKSRSHSRHSHRKRTREPSSVTEWKQGTEEKRDPDGYEAFSEYQDASERVDASLRALSRFWKACHLYLSGFGDRVVLTKVDAVELTNGWPKYQGEIENTMNTIMEACDAVMIEAKGLPTRTAISSKPGETSTLQTISSALISIGVGLGALQTEGLLEKWLWPTPRAEPSQQLIPSRTVNERGPMSSEEDPMLKFGASNY